MGKVCFVFSEIGPFKKIPHLTDLNRRLVYMIPVSNVKTQPSSKSDVDRHTDKLTTLTLAHAC